MNRTKPTESTRDERGVSETLGVILMFGLLVAALTIVQVNAVPTQNSKVEYQHDQDARTDFQEVRTAIIETAGADEPRSASVDLGVTYPGRLLFLNPGPVNGRLQTVKAGEYLITHSEAETIDIQQICGIDDDTTTGVETNALAYDIDYHVYSGDADHVYENTIVHQRSGTNGADVVHNDQQLIQGNTISLYPLVGDVQYSGTSGQSIDFVSAGTSTPVTKKFDNEWTLSIPSALSSETWKTSEQLLAGESNVDDVRDGGNGVVSVDMLAGTYEFRCTIVGVNELPEGVTPTTNDGDDSDNNDEINPVDDIVLVDEQLVKSGTGNEIHATFENKAGRQLDLVEVRANFYFVASQAGKAPTTGEIEGHQFLISGDYVTAPLSFASTGQTVVTLDDFYVTPSKEYKVSDGDFIVLTMLFDDPSTAEEERTKSTYFIGARDDSAIGSGTNVPSIDGFSVVDVTDTTKNPNKAEYEVTYSVSDPDNDIDDITIELIRDDGTTAASTSNNGNKLSNTVSLTDNGGELADYTVAITVTDDLENSIRNVSEIDTAGGS